MFLQEAKAYEVGRLKERLSAAAGDVSAARERGEFLERAVGVAEGRARELEGRERQRAGQMADMQKNCASYEQMLRKVRLAD